MSIEKKIQEKGLTAPRVTPADIEANIVREYYFTALDGAYGATGMPPGDINLGLLTFCVLVLKNDFMVTGEPVCVSPENFNSEIGRDIARENAIQKIWPLMNYALRERLSQ